MTNQIFRKGDIIKLAENGLWKFWYLDSELDSRDRALILAVNKDDFDNTVNLKALSRKGVHSIRFYYGPINFIGQVVGLGGMRVSIISDGAIKK